jgi:hypothetical protein
MKNSLQFYTIIVLAEVFGFIVGYRMGRNSKPKEKFELITCEEGLYYDLIRIPHGHIPAPKVKFWKNLKIPIKGMRTGDTFHCPNCGASSFFKVFGHCRQCYHWKETEDILKQSLRHERWRKRWKQLEYIILPLLVFFGKAWYMKSERVNIRDYHKGLKQ